MARVAKELKIIGGCLVGAAAWDYLWYSAIDQEGFVSRYMVDSAPEWARRFWWHWTPAALSVRILNVFGLRFDVAHWERNDRFMIISTVLEWLIWAGLFYGAILLWRRARPRHAQSAAA